MAGHSGTARASREARVTNAITSIDVAQVTKLYGATVALRGISARFEAGTITLIEGANGSGKSTLLGTLSTSIRPTSGTVTWAPLGKDASLARSHIGWLGHDALVYPDLSGIENLRWAAKVYGLEASAVEAVRERVGLGVFATRAVRTMSRGQKQRVALARALLHAPAVLLLDEPTTGLDRDGVDLLVKLVVAEKERGTLAVLIAHDATLAEKLGARVLKLARGRLADEA